MILRPKTQSEQITIKDLQNEIKNLKQEIQILKQNDITLEYRCYDLDFEDQGPPWVERRKGGEKRNYV